MPDVSFQDESDRRSLTLRSKIRSKRRITRVPLGSLRNPKSERRWQRNQHSSEELSSGGRNGQTLPRWLLCQGHSSLRPCKPGLSWRIDAAYHQVRRLLVSRLSSLVLSDPQKLVGCQFSSQMEIKIVKSHEECTSQVGSCREP